MNIIWLREKDLFNLIKKNKKYKTKICVRQFINYDKLILISSKSVKI